MRSEIQLSLIIDLPCQGYPNECYGDFLVADASFTKNLGLACSQSALIQRIIDMIAIFTNS